LPGVRWFHASRKETIELNEKTDSLNNIVAYIHGKIETQLEHAANATGIPFNVLVTRVCELLATNRQEWSAHSMPNQRMFNASTKATKQRATLEVVNTAHGTNASKTHSNSAIKTYWQRMTPLQRKREMKRRFAKRVAAQQKKNQ
jgi:hypothetical protein